MPRIRQCGDQYRNADFMTAVRVQQARKDMSQKELAEMIGVTPSGLCVALRNPERLTVERLRKMIASLQLEPEAMLRFLGYSEREIKGLNHST